MGCCEDINDTIPLIVEIHKYLKMAKYKAKQSTGFVSCKGHTFVWRKCTAEQLAFAYEELGLTAYVEKTNTKNEKNTKSNTKKGSKESSETDKGEE